VTVRSALPFLGVLIGVALALPFCSTDDRAPTRATPLDAAEVLRETPPLPDLRTTGSLGSYEAVRALFEAHCPDAASVRLTPTDRGCETSFPGGVRRMVGIDLDRPDARNTRYAAVASGVDGFRVSYEGFHADGAVRAYCARLADEGAEYLRYLLALDPDATRRFAVLLRETSWQSGAFARVVVEGVPVYFTFDPGVAADDGCYVEVESGATLGPHPSIEDVSLPPADGGRDAR
jgi:hypothetical protein